MGGKLNSLTDVLKKTLFFFEALTVSELAPHVQRKMLKDYTIEQVEEKINLCLSQNSCFYKEKGVWRLNLEGNKENDQFYALLLKKGQPLNLREILKNNNKKKKVKKILSEEASLISDGRFIQLDNGYWGLTEWEVEQSHYSLKHLVIKAMKSNPGGLSLNQLYQMVGSWVSVDLKALENLLQKFPYFEHINEGVWSYNPSVRVAYEGLIKRFLSVLNKQKAKWRLDRTRLKEKLKNLVNMLEESKVAQREAAAALAEKAELAGQYDYLLTQMAEKDLLLSLRKREIIRYREHLGKLEAKANSILHQCRLWVKRAREAQEEASRLRGVLSKNQAEMENLLAKLQQYKEKEREYKTKISDLKEQYSIKVAELQMEIVALKQKLEREKEQAAAEEKRLRDEISTLSSDLKKALRLEEEREKSFLALQQELSNVKEKCRFLEGSLKHPLVNFALRLCFLFDRYVFRKV